MQDLQVQCEAQVLMFVLDYIDSTQLEPSAAAQLLHHVRDSSCMAGSALSKHALVCLMRTCPADQPHASLYALADWRYIVAVTHHICNPQMHLAYQRV